MSKYGHRTHNWFEAIVNKLGGEEQAERFLRGDFSVCEPKYYRWHCHNGLVSFFVTSNGMTGPQWSSYFKAKGLEMYEEIHTGFLDRGFQVSLAVTTKVIIIKGSLFQESDRTLRQIRNFAARRGLVPINPEIICLLSDTLSGRDIEAMGLRAILMVNESEEPLEFNGNSSVIGLQNEDNGISRVCGYSTTRDSIWKHIYGFAFMESRSSAP